MAELFTNILVGEGFISALLVFSLLANASLVVILLRILNMYRQDYKEMQETMKELRASVDELRNLIQLMHVTRR